MKTTISILLMCIVLCVFLIFSFFFITPLETPRILTTEASNPCSPTPTINFNNALDIPNQISITLSENLILDAYVDCPDLSETTVFALNATLLIPDSDKVYELLWNDKTTTHHAKNPAEDGTGNYHDYYVSSNGDTMVCGSSIISYNTSFSSRTLNAFKWNYGYNHIASNTFYNADKYTHKHEFDFNAVEESFSYISAALNEWDISVSPEYDYYSLDYKTLSEQSAALSANPGYSWSPSDNAYFFILRQDIHGLPVTSLTHGSTDDGSMVSGSDIHVLISEDGIQKLMCASIYNISEQTKESVSIIPLEDAICTIESKYNNIIITSPITITHIELCYIPCKNSNQFKIVPAWIFKATQEDFNTGRINVSYVFVNAITGEEIV